MGSAMLGYCQVNPLSPSGSRINYLFVFSEKSCVLVGYVYSRGPGYVYWQIK